MTKASELKKHTLNLRDGDYEKLQSMFPDFGAGPIIRQLVSAFIDRTEEGGTLPNIKISGVKL